MEIIELAEMRKAFAPHGKRYKNPQKEIIKLRALWNNYKLFSKSKEIQEAKNLYQKALKLGLKDEEMDNIWSMIRKGLYLNPRFHGFYGMRGDIYFRQEKWSEAIHNYEYGKLMTRYDNKLSKAEAKHLYNIQLIESYTRRGDWYTDKNLLLEAVSDYEQVLLLKSGGMAVTKVEDKLLGLLRKLKKYNVFQRFWDDFVRYVNDERLSNLLTVHAEYKIHLKEMAVARQMLVKALHLNKKNVEADKLLHVVYTSGYTLAAFTVIWCMHGCFDKALMTVEKGLDCIPYNPGFTLLKTMILRLSGRLDQAISWLEFVNANFHKLNEPLKAAQGTIMGKLSIKKTRTELIKQWFMIRYDMAVKAMLNDDLNEAARIIYASNLTKFCMEPYILLGDIDYKSGHIDAALDSYLKCRKTIQEMCLPESMKSIDLLERIVDILNNRAKIEAQARRSKNVIELTNKVLSIIDEDKLKFNQLGMQRGRAILQKARGLLQIAKRTGKRDKECCKLAADSLRFIRDTDDSGVYSSLYGDRSTENVIDRYAPKKMLPRSLKILMQYS